MQTFICIEFTVGPTVRVTVRVETAGRRRNWPTRPTLTSVSVTAVSVCPSNNNNNNNKRQFVRRRNMSVDITRAPYRQSGNVVRDSSTETRL